MSTPPGREMPQATCSGKGAQMRAPSASRVATMPGSRGDCAEPSATAFALRSPVLQCNPYAPTGNGACSRGASWRQLARHVAAPGLLFSRVARQSSIITFAAALRSRSRTSEWGWALPSRSDNVCAGAWCLAWRLVLGTVNADLAASWARCRCDGPANR
jgi:hypothetical protein